MIRFLSFLFGKHYEPCKGCETLREQLEIVNHEKKEMLDTILNLVRPQAVQQIDVPTKSVMPATRSWRHIQREAEESSKNRARILEQQKADAVRLESELGINHDEEPREEIRGGN